MRLIPLSLLVLAAAACSPEPEAEPAPPVAPPVAVFTATDFAFTGPATIPAGHTTIRMETAANAEMHHVQLVKLEEGRTLEDLLAAMSQPGPLPAWARLKGGPNAPVPGGVSEAVVELTEGNWAAICVIPGPGGPHFAQGMVTSFTVTPNPAPAPAPEAHVVVSMSEYDYTLSTPLTAGTHTLRIDNAGSQPHEFVLARLDAGKTAQDMVNFILGLEGHGEATPPPGMPLGGTTNAEPGVPNWITVTVEPGEYAIICVFPDSSDGRPHMLHGMARQISVP